MAKYTCRIVAEDGTIVESILEAESKFALYESADQRNEMVLSIKPYKKPVNIGELLNSRKKVKPQELENFTTQLSVLIDSGIPLITSLEALIDQVETAAMKKVITGVVTKVNGGLPLSDSFASYPGVFDNLYVNMIRAGESAGVLDEILRRLSGFIQRNIETSNSIKKAMRYPKMVGGALGAAIVGATVFIIPKFTPMFESQGMELPLPTKILMGLSDFFINYWFLAVGGLFGAIYGIKFLASSKKGSYMVDLLRLRAPIIKNIELYSTLARFTHMLETLTHGGVQIVRSLETAEGTIGNQVISRDVRKARKSVESGVSLAESLGKSKWFPTITIKMIAIGEKSGALEKMLENIGKQYDIEVETRITKMASAIEPIMTVVMGAFVVLLVLGIMLPMWSMMGGVG